MQRTALITGASQGIGKAIALQLAKENTQVIITSNDQATLEQTAQEIKNFNPRVIAIPGDATLEDDIKKIVNLGIQHFGTIDILINNVGSIGQIKPFEQITTKEWLGLFNLNVMSGIHFSKEILPYMKKNNRGRIIFISSEKASEPGINMAHYCMSKAAIVSIAKTLANEVGKNGITVNTVSPGVILTPSWDAGAKQQNMSREEYASGFCKNVLTGQTLGNPIDVASLVCYLCSEAARWITGSNFRIDGGSVKTVQL